MSVNHNLAKFRNVSLNNRTVAHQPEPLPAPRTYLPAAAYVNGRMLTYAAAKAIHGAVRVLIKRNGCIFEGADARNLCHIPRN